MTYQRRRLAEETVQEPAVEWLTAVRGYDECFSDLEMRKNTPMDSAGVLDHRFFLIEVKPKIGGGTSNYTTKSGSLEKKIADTLGPLYRYQNDQLSCRSNEKWDRKRPVIIAFLAGQYVGAGEAESEEMLRRRSEDWLFDWRIWRWDGEKVKEYKKFNHPEAPDPTAYAACKIPILVVEPNRAPKRTLNELAELAEQQGVRELFDVVVRDASLLDFKWRRQRNSLALRRYVPHLGSVEDILSIYLDKSSIKDGLKIGYYPPQLLGTTYAGVTDDSLPGRPAVKGQFSSPARLLSTPLEVRQFLERFSSE